MKMRRTYAALALMGLFVIPACVPTAAVPAGAGAQSGQPDGDSGNDASTEGGDPGDAGDGTDMTPSDTSAALTVEQAAAVDAATAAADTTAQSIAAIAPTMDIQAMVEGAIAVPTCPDVDVTLNADALALFLDYGDGCTPAVYPAATVSGSVGGTVYITAAAFDLAFTDLTVDERALSGTVAGGFDTAAVPPTFAVNASLQSGSGASVEGSAIAAVDAPAGTLTLVDATLTLVDATSAVITAVFEDVVSAPQANGNFLPQSGSAEFELPSDLPGMDTIRVRVEFTAQTPVDGTVLVSVNDSDPVPYTPTS
ncbi:MAG: hypothetical protein HY763_02380 [Planctomycetes bacterium]|nr:hypothetical protein [Planctomycetota bacterium]